MPRLLTRRPPKRDTHGSHEANCAQVDRRQGAAPGARPQGCAEVHPVQRRCQEDPPLQARHHRAPRDPSLPEVDRDAPPQAPVEGVKIKKYKKLKI